MRVLVAPSDEHAVSHYRLRLPAQVLERDGVNIEFMPPASMPMQVNGAGRPIGLDPRVTVDFVDVLVIQRPTQQWQLTAIRDAQRRGIGVVVEVDDDLHSLPKHNALAAQLTKTHRDTLMACCMEADVVTVSSDALANRYGRHGRVRVLPNFVPESWLAIYSRRDETPTVGWTGTVVSHRDDLQATGGGVAAALKKHGGQFRVIGRGDLDRSGDGGFARQALGLDHIEVAPWATIDRYPHEIAKLHIGVAPLSATMFNRSKSWLKPMEMAALGVPCVMSPAAEYVRLHDTFKIGTVAERHDGWRREVGRLLADPIYRFEKGAHDREQVRAHLTIEKNSRLWLEAWGEARKAVSV